MLNREQLVEKVNYYTSKMESCPKYSKQYNVAKAMKCDYTKRLKRFDEKQSAIATALALGTPKKRVTARTTLEDAVASLASVEHEMQTVPADLYNSQYQKLQQRRWRLRKQIAQKLNQRLNTLDERSSQLQTKIVSIGILLK